MQTLLLTVAIFFLMVSAMMIGIIFGRRPIQGSCGGLGNKCASCTKPCDKKKS